MYIFKNSNIHNNFKNSIVAIGNFDGLHLGHQKVLIEAKKKAKKEKLKFGIITFEPIPLMYFNKKILNHRINNLKQKLEIFNKFKVDFVNIITFDKKFSNFSYLYFIKKIISKKLNCKFIFVSKNFRFGKNREGDIYKLKKFEESLNYKTIITKPLKKINKVLSSSMIRKLISKGEIKKVNQFLGRPWRIEGKVINGKKRGRKIGFPTCNLKIKDYVLPRLGVYAVKVDLANKRKKGIANIGYRPTFNGKSLLLEVNIFGLSKNLYKKTIKVDLIKFIRPEKKFKNINKLKEQIKKDIIIARK